MKYNLRYYKSKKQMKTKTLILGLILASIASSIFASAKSSSFNTTLMLLDFYSPDARITSVDVENESMTANELYYIINEYNKLLKEHDLSYRDDVFDCDDFARLFQTVTTLANVVYNKQFACGFVALEHVESWGGIQGGEGYYHAVNIIILEGVACIIEPQNFEIIQLIKYPNRENIISIDF